MEKSDDKIREERKMEMRNGSRMDDDERKRCECGTKMLFFPDRRYNAPTEGRWICRKCNTAVVVLRN